MTITCVYCDELATSGVNSVEGNDYLPVCNSDLTRLIADFGMVAVELIETYVCWGCDTELHMTETCWEC